MPAVRIRIDASSTTSRCGQTWTLSWASALVCWIEPDLTTVSSRCVCPPGPVTPDAGGAIVAVAVAAPAPAATACAASPPATAARRCLARSSRCAGILAPLAVSTSSRRLLGSLASAVGSRGRWRRSPRRGAAATAGAPPRQVASSPRLHLPSGSPSALRRSADRRSRCSGTSAMSLPSAYSGPEMPPSLRTRQKWTAMKMTVTNGKQQDVQHVPAEQGVVADLLRPEQHVLHAVPEHGCVPHHVGTDGHGPERQLVPRQQVAGEREQQREREQDHADDPVELAWSLVRAVVEDAAHVQEHRLSTMRCAAQRCMFRTSEPKVTAVSSVFTSSHADTAVGR